MNRNTAILIFANSATQEKNRKFFLKSEVLFDALNKEAILKAKQTGLPYFLVSEKEQSGATFGERYTNALASIFDQGFDHVISIGNDTPQLCSQHILDAAREVKRNKAVVGPSKDGGFYLLGIHKSSFNPDLLLQLPWQKVQLLETLLQVFSQKNIHAKKLQVLQDIDTLEDVQALKDAFYISGTIRFILCQIASLKVFGTTYVTNYTFKPRSTQLYNKGSPLAA